MRTKRRSLKKRDLASVQGFHFFVVKQVLEVVCYNRFKFPFNPSQIPLLNGCTLEERDVAFTRPPKGADEASRMLAESEKSPVRIRSGPPFDAREFVYVRALSIAAVTLTCVLIL